MVQIISRVDAKSAKLNRYFTGEKCIHRHVAERRTHNGECVECIRIGNKGKYQRLKEKDPKRLAGYKSRQYHKDPAKHRVKTDAWQKANPEKVAMMARRWRQANKERFTAMVRDWRARNPDKVRMSKYRRRMREAVGRGFDRADLDRMLIEQNNLCLGPSCGIDISTCFTVDHRLALSRGGTNDPENLQLLCRACNSSKGTRTEQEWRTVKAPD